MKRNTRYAIVGVLWVAAQVAGCYGVYLYTLAGR